MKKRTSVYHVANVDSIGRWECAMRHNQSENRPNARWPIIAGIVHSLVDWHARCEVIGRVSISKCCSHSLLEQKNLYMTSF